MKKLMIATAALCAAVGANALESANIVGYQEVEAPTGDSMRCPTFKMVGGAGYDLTKISVTGGGGSGDICAQIISSAGLWVGEYYWLTVDGMGVDNGWYKDMFGGEAVAVDEVVLDQGQAFYIHSDNEDLQLMVSGEVPAGDVGLTFAAGDGMLGNATPVDVDLTDVTVTGGGGSGDISAQSISSAGLWVGEYYWLTVDGMGVDNGWYKDMFGGEAVAADEVILAPGEALYLHSDSEDLTVTLPAVIQ